MRNTPNFAANMTHKNWEAKFGQRFLNLEGLFTTKSGYLIKEDPKEIIDFIHSTHSALHSALIEEIRGKTQDMLQGHLDLNIITSSEERTARMYHSGAIEAYRDILSLLSTYQDKG